MDVFKITSDLRTTEVQVGDSVDVDDFGGDVIVLSIVKVDFRSQTVWFTGARKSKLD